MRGRVAQAACRAVAKVDECIDRVVKAVQERGGTVLITADHGNAEMLWDGNHDEMHTAHTLNPVPLLIVSNDHEGAKLRENGVLADVAPTMLEILGIEKSEGMDGVSLFER